MFTRPAHRFGLVTLEEADDGGSGGGTATIADAAAAAANRLENAGEIVDNAAEGETPPASTDPLDGIDFNDLTYKQGKKLEQELKRDREKWRPWADTFGGLDDEARAAVLENAPTLGADLALITSTFAKLHPNDRQALANLAALVDTDPAAAAEGFANAAALLRGETLDDLEPPATTEGDDDQPMTRAEVQAYMDQRAQEAEQARAFTEAQQSIIDQAKELGYDPDSDDKTQHARFDFLIVAAGSAPDGTADPIAWGHELVKAYEQKVVDGFVAGKKADALRPPAPTAGSTPSPQEEEATTMAQGLDRARQRLEDNFGPLRR